MKTQTITGKSILEYDYQNTGQLVRSFLTDLINNYNILDIDDVDNVGVLTRGGNMNIIKFNENEPLEFDASLCTCLISTKNTKDIKHTIMFEIIESDEDLTIKYRIDILE